MSRLPLGEIMVELSLLRSEQLEEVLAVLRERERGRFGELALELGFIDEDGLARSLAQQFRLTALPGDRVSRLMVEPDVLDLLPSEFMREHVLVPTWFDPERRSLSLLVADPSDVVALKAAQQYARALQVRLFVSTRQAISELLDRALPATIVPDLDPSITVTGRRYLALPPREGGTVVLETDPGRLAALRRLEAIEGGGAEYVSDPEQVTALLEGEAADRVVYRRALAPQVEAYRGVWQGTSPGVRLIEVVGFTPGRVRLNDAPERDFLLDLLRRVVLEDLEPELRATVARATELAEALAQELRLTPEHSRAVSLCALLLHREKAREQLQEKMPFDIDGVMRRLEARGVGDPPSVDIALEVLHAASESAREDDTAASDPKVREALQRVLAREGLRERLADSPELVQSGLDRMPLAQVLRALVDAGRTAEVSVTGGAWRGVVRLSSGSIVWASWGEHSGEAAVEALGALRIGRWEVTFGEAVEERNVSDGTAALLERL